MYSGAFFHHTLEQSFQIADYIIYMKTMNGERVYGENDLKENERAEIS